MQNGLSGFFQAICDENVICRHELILSQLMLSCTLFEYSSAGLYNPGEANLSSQGEWRLFPTLVCAFVNPIEIVFRTEYDWQGDDLGDIIGMHCLNQGNQLA